VAALFADDARFVIVPPPTFVAPPPTGSAAIAAWLAERRSELHAAQEGRRHVMTNTVLDELTDDTCRSRTFLVSVATPEAGTPRIFATGLYRDRLERVGDRWRFVERHLELDGASAPTSQTDRRTR
jgi:hypothetical protein